MTGEQYQGYIPPDVETTLIDYMQDAMSDGFKFDVSTCDDLQGALLGEADIAENQGILGK